MIAGSVVTAKSRQIGQTRSPYSTSVIGALGLPRTLPDWGIPASSEATILCAAAFVEAVIFVFVFFAPLELTTIATTSAMTATPMIPRGQHQPRPPRGCHLQLQLARLARGARSGLLFGTAGHRGQV